MPIKKGDKVRILYTGKLDSGEIFDASSLHNDEPLEFVVGAQQVIPGFENAVIGKEVGDKFSIRIEPKDAYGERDPNARQKFDRSQLPPDIEPKVGMILGLTHQHDGHTHQIPAEIVEVDDDSFTLDFNHPLAGKTLNFEIEIVSKEEN